MGAYLSVPVTEKFSDDEEGKYLAYGASSMQGWRVSQEDAHNAIIDFDENTHLFAVYDGHGGHEVAAYTALKLPEFIKGTDAYSQSTESLPECLKKAFLAFDETLVQPEVVDVLKQIAGTKDDESESEEEEEMDNLYREAEMPLDEVMAKYAENPHLSRLMKEKKGVSPFLRAKTEGSSSSSSEPPIKYDDESLNEEGVQSSPSSSSSPSKLESAVGDKISPIKRQECDSENHQNGSEEQISSQINGGEVKHVNGEIDEEEKSKDTKGEEEGEISDKEKSDTNEKKEEQVENGEVLVNGGEGQVVVGKGKGKGLKGGKGKALLKNSEIQAQKLALSKEKRRDAAVRAQELYRKIQDNASEEDLSDDDDDEEDDNFEDGVNCEDVCEDSEEDDDDDDDDEDDDDDDDDDDEDDDEEEDEVDGDDPYAEFAMNMKEEPGYDSGCTACLALLRGSELYVANVGDSRIVVCRDGNAIDMSIDHKPEDDTESARIIAAGGRVTEDGRVNGGLNLSRAIGDHGYKQNNDLPPEKQMISPLPDVQSMTLGPKDQFMIVACDGIWNSMSSQEACTFVTERLKENMKLSTICEELFDHCLAPNTLGDGTGCDNMTCIIVTFKDSLLSNVGSAKRTSEEAGNEDIKKDDKKLKCDTDE